MNEKAKIDQQATPTHGISTECVIDDVKREIQAYLLDNGHAVLRIVTHWPELEAPLVSTIIFASPDLLGLVQETIGTLLADLPRFAALHQSTGGAEHG